MNGEAVYRTAPATPGLLIIVDKIKGLQRKLTPKVLQLLPDWSKDINCAAVVNPVNGGCFEGAPAVSRLPAEVRQNPCGIPSCPQKGGNCVCILTPSEERTSQLDWGPGLRPLTKKNPAYGRHWISRPMRIVAPIPKRTEMAIFFSFFWGGVRFKKKWGGGPQI